MAYNPKVKCIITSPFGEKVKEFLNFKDFIKAQREGLFEFTLTAPAISAHILFEQPESLSTMWEILRAKRKARNLTIYSLASITGVNAARISLLENGRTAFRPSELKKLERYLGSLVPKIDENK